ncbi:hypothetical protein DMH01_03505 [Amycolatopsis sp. WAC 04182]|uniref:helix-turn-helix domain-containing protein n=1 Tax=Amycolatopsis sp. WAC 04182 TaxID=2203198 RepID=UPI000F77EE2B|nr:helix-turn-helix domain-containing protein [Amycolatopsis sp. WAC 04182]RSN65456.1 hypothetical protein DMH01_03505 [Amycolatopsis sp. WAC 04182]
MKTYSIPEVAEMFGGESDWWLREGMRKGRFPFLQVGRERRFSEKHVDAIAEAIETRNVASDPEGADVSVFGATSRSAKRHRNRAAS